MSRFFKVVGHRGMPSRYPENTLPSFKAAIEAGVDAIEFDVHPTCDGRLVVTHDDTLERCSNGSGPVHDRTLAELRKLDFGMPIPDILCGLALIVYGWQRAGLPATPGAVAGFAVYCLAGWFLTYCLFLIPELLSFWFVSTNGVQALSSAVFDFNNTPMNLYPKWVQRLGILILPVFLITNFPTLYVMGALSPAMQVWGLAAPLVVFGIQRVIWRRAMRQYTSASG